MNDEKRKGKRLRYLRKVAARETRRLQKQLGRTPTSEELSKAKVRMWSPGLRYTLVASGGAVFGLGLILTFHFQMLMGVVAGLVGFMVAFLGWWGGGRETIGDSLKTLDWNIFDLIEGIIRFPPDDNPF